MMAQGTNARGGRDDPLKKSAGDRPETVITWNIGPQGVDTVITWNIGPQGVDLSFPLIAQTLSKGAAVAMFQEVSFHPEETVKST